ncbi:choice-of-anchor Q domain-containing protein [Patescibacteria group bacterium]
MNKIKYFYIFFFLFAVSFLALPVKAQAANWYLDNAASGSNSGTSWVNAWESFSVIAWGSVEPGDTIYISGGSSSKTYFETLTVGTSGTNSNFITITVGANSPYPSGHSGTVIIDGERTRSSGIMINGQSYIQVNGQSGSEHKLLVQNCTGSSAGGASVTARDAHYVYFDYIKVDNARSRGVTFHNVDHSRIRGCDIQTGVVNNSIQTDGIYIQYGNNNLVEHNTVLLANDGTSHCDCFQQAHNESGTIIRGNWFEWVDGHGNSDSQGFIVELVDGPMYIYNNVILGCSKQPYQAALFKPSPGLTGGLYYVWNNIIISQADNGIAAHFSCSDSEIAQIKNNIFYSPSGRGLYTDNEVSASKISNNFDGQNPGWNPTNEYRLNSESPCIDAGVNLNDYFTTGRDGNARPAGAAWDIGAYEFGGTQLLQGDVNNDGDVDAQDLRLVLAAWGPLSGSEDLNADGRVNSLDAGTVIRDWAGG